MKNTSIKRIKIAVLVIWLLAAAMVLSVVVSLAAYTSQGFKKGVATVTSSPARFSSDLLGQVSQSAPESDYTTTTPSVTTGGDTSTIAFNVYNYPPNLPGSYNEKDVEYTLEVTIRGATDYAQFRVDGTLFSTETLTTGSYKLARGAANHQPHTITMPTDLVGSVSFVVIAKPTAATANAVNQMWLAAKVHPTSSSGGTVTANDWKGHLVDNTANAQVKDYDAINYEIYGTGKGSLTLTWPNSLEIDKHFLNEKSLTATSDTTNNTQSVTISVDASDWDSRTIQFYYTNGPLTDWPAITYTFVPTP